MAKRIAAEAAALERELLNIMPRKKRRTNKTKKTINKEIKPQPMSSSSVNTESQPFSKSNLDQEETTSNDHFNILSENEIKKIMNSCSSPMVVRFNKYDYFLKLNFNV